MLDIQDLEKKWSKYHFKKVLPLYITSFVLATVVGAASYVYMTNPDLLLALVKEDKPQKKIPVVQVAKSTPALQAVQTLKKDEQNILVPSFNFIYNLEDQVINYNNAQKLASLNTVKKRVVKAPKAKKPAVKPKKATSKPKKRVKKAAVKPQKKVIPPKAKPVVKKKPKQAIVIGDTSSAASSQAPKQSLFQVANTTTSEDELRGVIKRFNKTKKPALSLFIAKKYYEQGNYKESYKYARTTYKLNPNIENGVILYAQSLAKLGKNDLAVSKLKTYIKKSGSVKAKILLDEMQQGNFK